MGIVRRPAHAARGAVLVAGRNGAAAIAATARSALAKGVPVFVAPDASDDGTAGVASEAGASVLTVPANVGKPAALLGVHEHSGLVEGVRAIVLLDDDRSSAIGSGGG